MFIYMYCCVCLYMYVYMSVHVCVSMHMWVFSMYLYLFVCVGYVPQHFVLRWDPNPASGDPDTIRIHAVVDPTHRRFEDRSIGWFVDQYQFMQWRPDGDSVPKLRHSMWVFALSHFLIYRYLCVLCFTFIISCGYLIYFTSVNIYITLWVMSEHSLYLFCWSEYWLVSFHVSVDLRYWLRPSIGYPRL